ncbi:MAG: PQQ-dependent sugar dehydrogenase [Acidimicrobiaceae bacterium]|nr:PQQ-dependent sugar dehydrogenase [Acidimicrobiaceae bacterium]MYG55468.1 PQQ-dependent sugar dehydrogenase [Acidimicrobiaceae bacterium]MYJ99313.1 PQQ-dependent sugar dehydrogenase [Acidimicrobiaceae bacterium]
MVTSTLRRLGIAVAGGLVVLGACATDDELAEPRPTVPVVTTAPVDEMPTAVQPDNRTQSDNPGTTDSATTTDNQTQSDNTGTTDSRGQPVRADGNVLNANIALEQVISLDEPIDMATAPGDPMVWIAERGGRVLRVDLAKGEVVETILDLSAETIAVGEQGLLGIAVSDDWLYANFTDKNSNTRLEAFKREGTSLSGERRTILRQTQPYRNHNGGAVAIGPDGHLYVAFGDGGAGGDPLDHGQNPTTWLGSMLRITPTPDSTEPYAVPADNPFASAQGTQGDASLGSPEVFLFGVRNPWRFSFDPGTGDLWIADVGQDLYEEVTVLLAANGGGVGANLGWRLREGLHEFTGDKPPGNVDPVWEYGQDDGCSVTGGFVYRGSEIDELVGSYLFGDYCTSRLWAVQISSGEVVFRDFGVAVPGGSLASFGQDADGELYALSLEGPVSRVVAG